MDSEFHLLLHGTLPNYIDSLTVAYARYKQLHDFACRISTTTRNYMNDEVSNTYLQIRGEKGSNNVITNITVLSIFKFQFVTHKYLQLCAYSFYMIDFDFSHIVQCEFNNCDFTDAKFVGTHFFKTRFVSCIFGGFKIMFFKSSGCATFIDCTLPVHVDNFQDWLHNQCSSLLVTISSIERGECAP